MGVIGFITGATLVESSLGYAFVSLKKLRGIIVLVKL